MKLNKNDTLRDLAIITAVAAVIWACFTVDNFIKTYQKLGKSPSFEAIVSLVLQVGERLLLPCMALFLYFFINEISQKMDGMFNSNVAYILKNRELCQEYFSKLETTRCHLEYYMSKTPMSANTENPNMQNNVKNDKGVLECDTGMNNTISEPLHPNNNTVTKNVGSEASCKICGYKLEKGDIYCPNCGVDRRM